MIGINLSRGYGAAYVYQNPNRVRTAAQAMSVPPVKPVPPVGAIGGNTSVIQPGSTTLPTIREGVDPVEMAVRGRIQYVNPSQPEDAAGINKTDSAADGEEAKDPREIMEESECQTCENRKYQDGSNDPGVSFKTATRMSPERAATAVRGHEMEHVTRERAKADREDRKVVQQSVTIHTAICPECGDVYVSGGTTRTTTAKDNSQELAQKAREGMLGRTLDTVA